MFFFWGGGERRERGQEDDETPEDDKCLSGDVPPSRRGVFPSPREGLASAFPLRSRAASRGTHFVYRLKQKKGREGGAKARKRHGHSLGALGQHGILFFFLSTLSLSWAVIPLASLPPSLPLFSHLLHPLGAAVHQLRRMCRVRRRVGVRDGAVGEARGGGEDVGEEGLGRGDEGRCGRLRRGCVLLLLRARAHALRLDVQERVEHRQLRVGDGGERDVELKLLSSGGNGGSSTSRSIFKHRGVGRPRAPAGKRVEPRRRGVSPRGEGADWYSAHRRILRGETVGEMGRARGGKQNNV